MIGTHSRHAGASISYMKDSVRFHPPPWRLGIALAVSVLVHALILCISLDGETFGLPGLRLPWTERRAAANELRIVLAPALPRQPSAGAAAPDPAPSLAAKPARQAANTAVAQRTVTPDRPVRAPSPKKATAISPRADQPAPVAATGQVPPPAASGRSASAVSVRAPDDEVRRAELAREEARRAALAEQEAALQERLRQEAIIADEARRSEAERAALAAAMAARLEADRQALQRQQMETQAQVAAARQEQERQEQERQELARQEQQRHDQAKQEQARQEQARQEQARQEKSRQDEARQAQARLDQARQEREGLEAARNERLRAIGRQLDQEAAQRDQAKRTPDAAAAPTTSGLRRGWMFGRADPNAELVQYAQAMGRKIEFNMTFDTVRDLVRQPHTQPVVTIAVRSDGSVERVTFVTSSGVPAIDAAIRDVIASQAPFGPFPPALARQYDVVEIRRTWKFDTAIRLE